ncbi:MAG: AAA family ATPase, partial [Gammaproteobacteria bacterium]
AMISMAAIVTTGGTWPVDRTPCERGSVIVASAEDDAEDTIRPRLEAAGADLQRVYTLDAVRETNKDGASTVRPFNLTADIDRLKVLGTSKPRTSSAETWWLSWMISSTVDRRSR